MKTQKLAPFKVILTLAVLLTTSLTFAQSPSSQSRFIDNVSFGGGLGLNFGTGYFGITVAPSAIYNFNEYLSAGPSLIYSYQSDDIFKSALYGGSVIGLFNPIREIQLSTELEQVRVNQTLDTNEGNIENNFWNTALFLGGGYRTGQVTVGARYDVLYKEGESVYASAWAPFVRVYF